MFTITAPIRDDATREAVVDYLTSEGIDATDTKSIRVLDDGRIEAEMFLRDAEGRRLFDRYTYEVPDRHPHR